MVLVIESFSAAFALKKFYNMVCDITGQRVSDLLKVDVEIRKLIDDLDQIRKNLEEVEKQQTAEEAWQKWLRDLKDLAYDGEDVVDEFATEVEINQCVACNTDPVPKRGLGTSLLGAEQVRNISLLKRLLLSYSGGQDQRNSSPVLVRLDIADKIKAIQSKLDELLTRRDRLRISAIVSIPSVRQEESGQRPSKRPQVGSSLDCQFEMVGREKEKEKLLNQLIGTHTASSTKRVPSNVSVMSIFGMGGVGKSTLAQMVYKDPQVVSHFRDMREWLSVGESFDLELLIEKLTDKTIEKGTQLDKLQERLKEKVRNKRFLIVLDDVWNWGENQEDWERLWIPLSWGSQGSRVLITCRDKQVVQATRSMSMIKLHPLTDDECLSIFLKYAFPEGNSEQYTELKGVAKEIGRKLKGLPLAAKVVGSSLFNNFEEDSWNNILANELWASEEKGKNNILNQLKWSYSLLPPYLKQCFGYCSIFKKDHNFDVHDLVLQWMAAGLIQPQGSRRLEDIGMDYFTELLQKSFFDYTDNHYKIKMHDLIHDLAELVSSHECARHERLRNVENGSSSVRHLSLRTSTVVSPYNFQKVRTLLYTGQDLEDDFLDRLKYIRILDLRHSMISNVHAEQISKLKQLRYFACQIGRFFPELIGKLYNLQILVLIQKGVLIEKEWDDIIGFVPIKGISNLSKLRHLKAPTDFVSRIESLGRLTALQFLKYFDVREEAGHGIEELQNLTQLREHLCIRNLEMVKTKEEAKKSKLIIKERLNKLSLSWNKNVDSIYSPSVLNDILEALQPHPKLQQVTIRGYGGTQLPRWEKGSRSLKHLSLVQCERLLFHDYLFLRKHMNLRNLTIWNCPKFSRGLSEYITDGVGNNASASIVLPYLEKLTIDDIQLFSTFLESGHLICKASSLKEIKIRMAKDTNLSLSNENMKTEQLSLFTSLRKLSFTALGCKDLPCYLYLLPFLKVLHITGCPYIQELPKKGLPKSLQRLTITYCPILVERCRQYGPDWEKIKHIPHRVISSEWD